MHAAALAEELGIERILCPRASGVLSALGLLASERRRDTARTVMLSGDELSAERIAGEVARASRSIGAGLDGAEAEVDLRAALPRPGVRAGVPGPGDPDPASWRSASRPSTSVRYGYRDPEAEVELVDIRLAMVVPGAAPQPEAAPAGSLERAGRRARFGGRVAGGGGAARRARGRAGGRRARASFELPEATLVLPPGWRARGRRATGTIVAERTP